MSSMGEPIAMAPFQAKNEKERGQTHLYNISLLVLIFLRVNKTSSQAPSYASPKLWPTDWLTRSLTGVKFRATSVAKKEILTWFLATLVALRFTPVSK